MHTTCQNPFCKYKFADLHETNDHVIIYCQNCGSETKHERKHASERPIEPVMPKFGIVPGGRKHKKRKGGNNNHSFLRAG